MTQTLNQIKLRNLQSEREMCMAYISGITAKLIDAEERLAYLNAEIEKLSEIDVDQIVD